MQKIYHAHVVLICSLFVNNLMPMVTIAPDCIIAVGSVVTKSCLTPGCLYGGVPAILLKKLT